MKKIVMSLAACLVCVALLAACGGSGDSKTESGNISSSAVTSSSSSGETTFEAGESTFEAGESTSEAGAAEADETSSEVGSDTFSTLEDFINSDEMQSQISSIVDSIADSGITVDVTAEGNRLTYLYTYSADILEGVDMDSLTSTLNDVLESSADTFEGIASSLKSAVNIDDPVVVVTYAKADGTIIATREFTAN